VTPEAWRRRAQGLAWLTVGYNLLEGAVALGFGVKDDSVALWGFGLDSLVEVASGLVVLWRLRDPGAPCGRRERRATAAIGWLFLVLASGVALGAVRNLLVREVPQTTLPGLVIALVSLSFMLFLWRAKRAAAVALDSAALAGDAACSLACIQLSGVLLGGSLLFRLSPALGWVDAAAALALAGLIAREGWAGVKAARDPGFTGGCGCH
jgi:divalent metal cation (Fe/Co/Zn/Cd) transporter